MKASSTPFPVLDEPSKYSSNSIASQAVAAPFPTARHRLNLLLFTNYRGRVLMGRKGEETDLLARDNSYLTGNVKLLQDVLLAFGWSTKFPI